MTNGQTISSGDRVVFTTTGCPGEVLRTYDYDGPYAGDQAGPWAVVRWDDGETMSVMARDLTLIR